LLVDNNGKHFVSPSRELSTKLTAQFKAVPVITFFE
jgi:hypothetical protein